MICTTCGNKIHHPGKSPNLCAACESTRRLETIAILSRIEPKPDRDETLHAILFAPNIYQLVERVTNEVPKRRAQG